MVVSQGCPDHARVARLSGSFVTPFGFLQGLPVLQHMWGPFGQGCVANAPRPMLIEAIFCHYTEEAEKHEARALARQRVELATTVAGSVPQRASSSFGITALFWLHVFPFLGCFLWLGW